MVTSIVSFVYKVYLFFMPFTGIFYKTIFKHSKYVTFIDDIVILIGIIYVFVLRIFNKTKRKIDFSFFLSILLFIIIIGSGLYNSISWGGMLIAWYDYIKVVWILLIFLNLRKEIYQEKYFLYFRKIALIIAIIGIYQTLAYHFMGKMYPIFSNKFRLSSENLWLRASGTLGHPNFFGLYMLLFLIKEIYEYKKLFYIFIYFIAVLFSGSRMAFLGVIFIPFLHWILYGKFTFKKIFTICFICLFSIVGLFSFSDKVKKIVSGDLETSIRGKGIGLSLRLLSSKWLTGTGPSSFGGTSLSRIDEKKLGEYGLDSTYINVLKKVTASGIESNWLQVFTEIGFLGFFLYVLLFLNNLYLILVSLKNEKRIKKNMILGMYIYQIFIGIFYPMYCVGFSIMLCYIVGLSVYGKEK